MKVSKDIEHRLKVFYRRYREEELVRQFGLFVCYLGDEYGIHSGNLGAKVADANWMMERGWIKVLSACPTGHAGISSMVQFTEEGIRYVEWLQRPLCLRPLRSIYVATVEGITRGLKK